MLTITRGALPARFGFASLTVLGLLLGVALPSQAVRAENLKLLFLGDRGHHKPADRFAQIKPVLARRGIDLAYTERVADLNPETLGKYDGLIVYANIERIAPEQEQALLDYVAGGKGFIPIHCASYCFLNSVKYVELVGAQFRRHGTGTFRTTIAAADHPVMRNFGGFESWDETYAHARHNEKDRTVLSYRVDAEGREPWTWVRTHGKGRVFYTAWGHDQRTWGQPGFQNLLERGIRWACGDDPATAGAFVDRSAFPVPEMTPQRKDVKPFEYVEAKVAYYPPRGGGRGDGKWNQMQLPLPAEESIKHFVAPVGFHVELFAAEPDIRKPIAISWDERGRLWVAETVDYPNQKQRTGRGRDSIRICEDTDGDGRADKFTLFADKLSIPTSLIFHRGGVIVHQPPETLFLGDTDGDDVADVRQVLFRGWSTGDTHAGPSNLRYGLDNWYWGMVGYAGFGGEIGGQRQSFRTGFYRFQPPARTGLLESGAAPLSRDVKFEFIRNTNNNSWGVGFSEEGVLFGSTANRNPSVYMPIPNRYYEQVRGFSSTVLGGIADTHLFRPITTKVRQVDQHGGYTAAAGHALYTARTYPPEYWNRAAFVTGATGHLVGTFVIDGEGSDYHSRNPFNLLASDDEWTAPIVAEVGPDGHVWVIDWYNYIVQHNPTPAGFRTGRGAAYETDLRDKTHGRIYRVVYDAAPKSEPFSLASASPEQLVKTLSHPNMLWRLHAQRLLVERGERDVVPRLVTMAGDRNVDEIGLNVGVIHALWTLHGLGAFEADDANAAAVAISALKHPSAGVRRNAVQVLARNEKSAAAILDAGLLADPDGQVRLAALLALSEMPASERAAEAVLAAVENPANGSDRWMLDAATAAAAANDLAFLKTVALGAKSAGVESAPDTRSVRGTETPLRTVVGRVAEHYARGGPADSVGQLVAVLDKADAATSGALISALARGWPRNRPVAFDESAEKKLADLLVNLSPGAQGQLLRLASVWGSRALEKHAEEIAEALGARLADEDRPDEDRLAAARQLIDFRSEDASAVEQLLEAITPQSTSELAGGLLAALDGSRAENLGPAVLRKFPTMTPVMRQSALRVLLAQPAATSALLRDIEKGELQVSDLTLQQQQALATHPDRRIAALARRLLSRGGGLPDPDRQKVLESLLAVTEQQGDVERGKLVFKKQCAACHMHSGEGKKVGPDLTGMSVHPKSELLTQILDPSRSVEGNYRAYKVVTADGRVLTGLLASETKTSIELFDAEGKQHVVLRADVEQLVASRKSVMPEGFEKQIKPAEFVDLLEFLTAKGRFVPLPLAKAATAVSTRGLFHTGDNGPDRMIFRSWEPKTFADVPFQLIDPRGKTTANIILLNGPRGTMPPRMPKSVRVACNAPAKAVHLLSGVSGWGYPAIREKSVSMIVRLHYADGQMEDHPLRNGVHFADYIRRVDVPESKFAFALGGQQIRYLSVTPKRSEPIHEIEFVKGADESAPIIMAVTVETPAEKG